MSAAVCASCHHLRSAHDEAGVCATCDLLGGPCQFRDEFEDPEPAA